MHSFAQFIDFIGELLNIDNYKFESKG